MNQTTQAIVSTFENFRMRPTSIDQFDQVGKQNLSDKIDQFVTLNRPVEFVMLGLPFKSINIRDKVVGVLPDLGEKQMMKRIENFNYEIKKCYSPGVNVTIVSDGFIFNNILGVNDHIVEAYKDVAMDLAKNKPIDIYDLREFYRKGQSINTSREKLLSEFSISPEKLEQLILFNPDTNELYKGMIRFMSEEFSIYNFASGNQLHKHSKKIARDMMMVNEAYSNLVNAEFTDYIRLSMHNTSNTTKFSFQLIDGDADKIKHSPWHSVLAYDGTSYSTMHRKEAEMQGYELMYEEGRPFYYNKK